MVLRALSHKLDGVSHGKFFSLMNVTVVTNGITQIEYCC